jgi:hypothetical protein
MIASFGTFRSDDRLDDIADAMRVHADRLGPLVVIALEQPALVHLLDEVGELVDVLAHMLDDDQVARASRSSSCCAISFRRSSTILCAQARLHAQRWR